MLPWDRLFSYVLGLCETRSLQQRRLCDNFNFSYQRPCSKIVLNTDQCQKVKLQSSRWQPVFPKDLQLCVCCVDLTFHGQWIIFQHARLRCFIPLAFLPSSTPDVMTWVEKGDCFPWRHTSGLPQKRLKIFELLGTGFDELKLKRLVSFFGSKPVWFLFLWCRSFCNPPWHDVKDQASDTQFHGYVAIEILSSIWISDQ